MTERLRNKLALPTVIAIIGLLVTIGTITVQVSAKAGATEEKVLQMEEEMNTCKGKIDDKIGTQQYYQDINDIKNSLNRIENKLDKHIAPVK